MDQKITFDMMPRVLGEIISLLRELSIKVDKVAESSQDSYGLGSHKPLYMDDVCGLLKKSKATIYRMSSKGEIPCYKQGKNLLFFEDEILQWMALGKKEYFDRRV